LTQSTTYFKSTRAVLFSFLRQGNLQAFIEGLIRPPSNITIDYSKVQNSPVVKALSGKSEYIAKKTWAYAESVFEGFEMITVGDVFNRFISPLGLELYWVKEGLWSLEPPRLSVDNPTPDGGVISKTEIVDMQLNSDPYNAPDVVIPSMVRQSSLGAMATMSDFAGRTLAAGIIGKSLGGKNLKVSTYDIPSFLFPEVRTSVLAVKDFGIDKYEGGIAKQTDVDVAASVASFFGAHARKSALYSQVTGYCVLVFSPHITKSYTWYIIDGQLCFVSDIVHNISRSSASTVLTIAGVYTDDYSTGGLVGNSPSKMPEYEKDFNNDVISQTEEKTRKIKEDVKEGSKPKKKESEKETEDDMEFIFGDWEEHQDAVAGKVVEVVVDFTPPEKEQ